MSRCACAAGYRKICRVSPAEALAEAHQLGLMIRKDETPCQFLAEFNVAPRQTGHRGSQSCPASAIKCHLLRAGEGIVVDRERRVMRTDRARRECDRQRA